MYLPQIFWCYVMSWRVFGIVIKVKVNVVSSRKRFVCAVFVFFLRISFKTCEDDKRIISSFKSVQMAQLELTPALLALALLLWVWRLRWIRPPGKQLEPAWASQHDFKTAGEGIRSNGFRRNLLRNPAFYFCFR